jgi:hypothetical protein
MSCIPDCEADIVVGRKTNGGRDMAWFGNVDCVCIVGADYA